MRIFYWLLGAAATAAATAYVVRRGRKDRIAKDFLDALRQGPVVIHADQTAIIAPGQRAVIFKGEAGGRAFGFAAKADASSTRWIFALDWVGVGRIAHSWNPISGEPDHPLQTAYLILLRLTTKSRGAPN